MRAIHIYVGGPKATKNDWDIRPSVAVKALSANILCVVATTYYNNKWSHKQVNLKSGYNVGSSQENSTRSLFLIRVLFIQSPHGPYY